MAKRNYAVNELGYACKGIPDKDWEGMTNDEQLVYCYSCKLGCSYGNDLIIKDHTRKEKMIIDGKQNLN